MKKFKTFVTEVSAQKASKDFEDYIWRLAVLSGGKITDEKKLEDLIDNNMDKFSGISKKHKQQTLSAVLHLNSFFPNEIWRDGYNANFDKIPKPVYGNKSAKADIVLVGSKKYGLSVKMAGDYVVVSAQNKDEFQGIFYSALDYFEKNNKLDLSDYESNIEKIKKEIKIIRDTVIGETLTRHLKPNHFDKLKKDKDFLKHEKFLEKLNNNIKKQNQKINNDYDNMMKTVVKSSQKEITNLMNNNPEVRNYIVWEALTAKLKYKGKLPAADYVISPTGCYDIRNPNNDFVKKVASESKIGIRGMVHGKLRSGSAKALKPYLNNTKLNWNEVYNKLNKMDMSLKWDMPSRQFSKLKVESLELNEGILSNIWNKVKGIWNNIKINISNSIKSSISIIKNMLNVLSLLKKASIFDLLSSNDIDFDIDIRIK
jgi:hypothetical protein